MAALAVQGPTSRSVLQACAQGDVEKLKFRLDSLEDRSKEGRLSRTGYTGDLGYEVWSAWDDGLSVWTS